jgi:hypothetical protein
VVNSGVGQGSGAGVVDPGVGTGSGSGSAEGGSRDKERRSGSVGVCGRGVGCTHWWVVFQELGYRKWFFDAGRGGLPNPTESTMWGKGSSGACCYLSRDPQGERGWVICSVPTGPDCVAMAMSPSTAVIIGREWWWWASGGRDSPMAWETKV